MERREFVPDRIHAWSGPIHSQNLSYQFLPVELAKSRARTPCPSLRGRQQQQHPASGKLRHLVPLRPPWFYMSLCLFNQARTGLPRKIHNWTSKNDRLMRSITHVFRWGLIERLQTFPCRIVFSFTSGRFLVCVLILGSPETDQRR